MADCDEKLMERVRQGERGAFDALVQKYRQPVLNMVFRYVGDCEEAEQMAQEVFLRVYEARRRYRATAKFSTWLYRIVTNICLDAHRRRQARPRESPHAPEEVDRQGTVCSPSPHEAVERAELQTVVRAAIAALPPRQRLAVVLQRYEGLSYQEIGEALGCSRNAVETLLHRARQNLREQLRDYVEEKSKTPQVSGEGCVKENRPVWSEQP